MGIKLGDNINITAGLPNDCRYQNAAVGPYTSVSQANSIVTSDIRYTGLTVNIGGTEYWYKNGITDVDLVEKTTGGGSGLLNWTGSTANAIGTYMSISGICAQPNMTFDGSTLSVTGIISATTCFAGSGAGLTGTASSLTVGTATTATNLAGLTATASEINTVADGSTAKNSHVHGSINSGGCLGTAAGCIVCTTTSGCLATITPSSLTVGTATNATTASNLAGLTATASELNTVADGSTAKNSHTHDDRYYTESESNNNYVSKTTTGTNSFNGAYLIWSDGGETNRDFIAYNDTTNAFYFNADTSLTSISGNAAIFAGTFNGSGEGLTGTASSLTVGNATTATNSLCLGGQAAANYLRSNADDNLTAAIVVPTANRDEGIFGTYDSTKTQHIWSMGTAYRNAADGTTFGNLYGLAYKYNGGAGGHGVYLVQNGSACAGLGTNVWTAGCFIGSGAGLTGTASSLTVGTATNATNATNALCLGGVVAASYLRSDTLDCKTSGNLRFYDNICATFGTGADLDIVHTGAAAYLSNITGDLFLRVGGIENAFRAIPNAQVILYHDNIQQFQTCSTGTLTSGVHCSSTCGRSPVYCATTAFRSTGTGYRYCGGTGCGTAVDWVATSDCRIKKCIVPITSALSMVDALCGVCYELCENDNKDMGLIAQDVFLVEPRLVAHSEPIEEYKKYGIEDEILSLKYDKFAGLFVEAIKELKLELESLKTEIKDLKDEKNI